jgi:DNA-binding XRE family transcriptional regulator
VAIVKNAPTAEQVRSLRLQGTLTQEEAAAVVYLSKSGWQKVESGQRNLHPGLWELWQIKTGLRPDDTNTHSQTGS